MQAPPPEVKSVPMINSFLNLCRVCPVPTDDKINSEYKRNFTWHDGYQATKVDVVRNAPSMPSAEPSLPRKKKYPGQMARDHLLYDEGGESSDSLDIAAAASHAGLPSHDADSRARSEERNHMKSRASIRSRSADSTISRRLKVTPIPDEDTKPAGKPSDDTDSKRREDKEQMAQPHPPSTNPRENPGTPGAADDGTVPKTTEYRSQFIAWPRSPGLQESATRKSASMGLIASQILNKKDVVDGEVHSADLWSSVADDDDESALDAVKRGRIKKTEYKAKFRPFSAYTYVDGSWKKATRLIKDRAVDDMDIYSSYSYPLIDGHFTTDNECGSEDQNAWYSEVVERLKKADQYRTRSHAGAPLYGSGEHLPPELLIRDRTILSPVSVASSSRTWKDDRPIKERGRTAYVPLHHRKEKKDGATDGFDQLKSRDGSTKKKPLVEKTTVRPKSAEPVIPVKSEHKSPKRTRPRAPKDLPVHGHGDLSGRKKAYRQSVEKAGGSPVGGKPRAVSRPSEKVWLKSDKAGEGGAALVNGFAEDGGAEKMVNGEAGPPDDEEDQSVHEKEAKMNGEHVPVMKYPAKVPLTTVKSPEEVTGVRSPDPESWTVPLEIGKGLHWMDGKTPDGVQQPKGPPILLSKRLKESSLVGKSQKDLVICDPGSEGTGESVDL